MPTIHPSSLLRQALWLDAAATGAMALLQLGLGPTVSTLTRLPSALIVETGLFMVVYVLALVLMARNPRLPAALVTLIVVGNTLWAVGAAAVGVMLAPAAAGVALLAAHALAVLVFAALQTAGLRRSAPALAGHAA